MMWVPAFSYPEDDGTDLALTLPLRHWTERMIALGGYRESAAGVRASFTVRRDYLLDIVIRIEESELAALQAFIEWAQDNPATAFTFWPDAEEDEASFAAVLISPMHGADLLATRGETGSDMEVSLTFRQAAGGAWGVTYYPAEA